MHYPTNEEKEAIDRGIAECENGNSVGLDELIEHVNNYDLPAEKLKRLAKSNPPPQSWYDEVE